MKKQQNIAILSIALLILGGGLVLAGCGKEPVVNSNQNQNQNININTNQNANINTDTSTTTGEIDTSNWRTYKNEEYGFEFKYPADWEIFIFSKSEAPFYEIKNDNKFIFYSEIKSLEKNEYPGLTHSEFPPYEIIGSVIKFYIKSNINHLNYDDIIDNCFKDSLDNKCEYKSLLLNNKSYLIIEDLHQVDNMDKVAYLLMGDKIFEITFNSNDIGYNNYKIIFYNFLKDLENFPSI